MGSKSEDNGGRSDKMVASESFKTKQSDVPESSTERCNEGRSVKMMVEASLKTKLSHVPMSTSEPCIYRVPRTLRKADEEAYTPQLVSIGPYHRETPRLKSMVEVDKLRYVKQFLTRKPENTVEFYLEGLTYLEERARQCYAQPVDLTRNEFVEMLLIDGCFIIEFVLMGTAKIDYLRCPRSMNFFLIHDIQLMENQLPFFVLEHLYNLISSTDSGNKSTLPTSFLNRASDFFFDRWQIRKQRNHVRDYEIKHILDLYTAWFVPSPSNRIPPKGSLREFARTPNITELDKAGVKFQNVENSFILNIEFTDTGILNIPHIHVTTETEILLRNFMAFEYFNDQTFYVTDYAILMDSLVNNPNDIAILRTNGIVDSKHSDEEVSHLFNMLSRGTITSSSTFYYSRLCEDVNVYYKKRWNVLRAKLKRDYFNTPWSTLSFIAAVVLLICSLVQSVFSAISYLKPG